MLPTNSGLYDLAMAVSRVSRRKFFARVSVSARLRVGSVEARCTVTKSETRVTAKPTATAGRFDGAELGGTKTTPAATSKTPASTAKAGGRYPSIRHCRISG